MTNWDYGASLGEGKLFILEDKATEPVQRKIKQPLLTHRITIGRDQLDWYCDEVEPVTGLPVYYVLPQPPWHGPPSGSAVVPDQSVCRVASPSGPFAAWAWVIRCSDLRKHLNGAGSLLTDQLPLPHSESLRDFLDAVAQCRAGLRVSGSGEGEAAATKGVQLGDTLSAARAQLTPDDTRQRFVGSALAFFVPLSDLTVTP